MSLWNPGSVARTLEACEPLVVQGRVVRAAGLAVEALLPGAAVGTSCEIRTADGRAVAAEVVGFSARTALLVPFGDMEGVCEGCAVVPRGPAVTLRCGDALLGRVVDAAMRPLDGGPEPLMPHRVPLNAPPPPAMARRRIARPVPTGIRVLDAFLTAGEGQRLGVFAGPGVGKSVLLGMLARGADADAVVVGLVGERGREVREFVERDLGDEGRRRSTVVVATSDEPPLRRLRGAMAATALAEFHRSRGRRVLLLLDSLTRVAMAQREIGLSAGEPPTSKGYPPSVFAVLPRLLERAGNDAGRGSITLICTVLAEGDDLSDPIADAARALLDGHVVLSRKLAAAGRFPAVDVLASVSRVMPEVTAPAHRALAREARALLAARRDAADLVDAGAYAAGSNPAVDRALELGPALDEFLCQDGSERTPFERSLERLRCILSAKGGDRA